VSEEISRKGPQVVSGLVLLCTIIASTFDSYAVVAGGSGSALKILTVLWAGGTVVAVALWLYKEFPAVHIVYSIIGVPIAYLAFTVVIVPHIVYVYSTPSEASVGVPASGSRPPNIFRSASPTPPCPRFMICVNPPH
jgi:hypothetical protein